MTTWRLVDGACRSDRKRTQQYNISQVMKLLADSSDGSGSGLNLSDLGVGGNSSASYGPFLLKLPYYHQKMYLVFDIFCFYKFYIFYMIWTGVFILTRTTLLQS